MKVCAKCGAVQQDERILCIDCGERLPEPLSDKEAANVARSVEETINKQYNKSDPLAVDTSMKIAACVDIAAAVFSAITAFISNRPEKSAVIIAFIWYIFSFVDALFPEFIWTVSKLKDIFRYENIEDLDPSFWYTKMRRIGVWAAPVIGLAITVGYLIL